MRKKDLEHYGLRREDACNRKKWQERIIAKIANPGQPVFERTLLLFFTQNEGFIKSYLPQFFYLNGSELLKKRLLEAIS